MTNARLNILFYTFLSIFVATAVITLLGVIGITRVPAAQLNALLGAFLIALAGAVIAVFRRTEFFQRQPESVAGYLGSAFEGLDRISEEIPAAIEGPSYSSSAYPFRFLIRRAGNSVVAYQRMNVITGEQLDHLPEAQRALVKRYEESIQSLVHKWMRLKGASGMPDARRRERELELLRLAKGDLVALLDFLQAQGIYLDDHYSEVRALVASL